MNLKNKKILLILHTKSPRLILLKIRKFAKLHLTPSYWLFEGDFLHFKF
ncbi:hypothetical protein LEP1GSC186_1560 [Leptospira noguchii serovar Autumnalis str. ZUN142]|uniref:Uncharacterized protein n=1 Tax=Leptospira noguchii serovar Autumnalis str. ZUN142 TaxID=1085540 RepID=M6UCK0_9LEPT|nr:hypothetical protein LEP1GSC186_1560 [Leptospira noguchii serovar Autumnalis str. ZUN142]